MRPKPTIGRGATRRRGSTSSDGSISRPQPTDTIMANQRKPSTASSPISTRDFALKRAKQLMGCYRLGEVGDPETYSTAVVAVLLRYPPDVVTAVTEPATG